MKRHLINVYDDLVTVLQQSNPQSKDHLGKILVEEGWLTAHQLQDMLILQRHQPSKHLGELAIESNLCSRAQIREALATKLGFPFVTLGEYEIPSNILDLIPARLTRHYKVLPLAQISGHLVVAMETPLDQEALNALSFNTNMHVDPVMTSANEIQQLLGKYYNPMLDSEIDGMVEALELNPPQEKDVDNVSNPEQIAREAQKKPIVKLANAIITNGIIKGASDINIRPEKDKVSIYYRIYGKLQFSRSLHKSLLAPIVNRIKITGRMDISERRLPQDGHARMMREEHSIDLRISSIPTVDGESIVIRILDKDAGLKPLNKLGFSLRDYTILNRMLKHSFGLILVTGPTGSGKSTTLYALLNEIRKREPHIITVEDPVEYDMAGVEQIQIIPAINYTFNRALRNILRHDPDVIMVGEIRDEETAEITNKAALTGHLVLSTLHTNSASGTITRLFDMNVKPYLLSSTLLGIMAQRLVRVNCPKCKQEEDINDEVRKILHIDADELFYHGVGCKHCNDTGFTGRAIVYELLEVSPKIAELINQRASTQEIKNVAIEEGMVPLTANALALAREGLIPIEEVLSIGFD